MFSYIDAMVTYRAIWNFMTIEITQAKTSLFVPIWWVSILCLTQSRIRFTSEWNCDMQNIQSYHNVYTQHISMLNRNMKENKNCYLLSSFSTLSRFRTDPSTTSQLLITIAPMSLPISMKYLYTANTPRSNMRRWRVSD